MTSRLCATAMRWGGLAAAVFSATALRTVGAERIPVTLDEGTNFAAALAPDGSFVLDLQGTLFRLPAEGGRAEALTDALGDDRLPDVGSTGDRIVFQSYRNGTWDVWTIEAPGSPEVALTEGPADDREPVLSPDGTRVAFSSDRSGNYDVFLLELATGEVRAVTTDRANDYMPAFAPSGEALVFVSDRNDDGRVGLFEVALTGGVAPRLLASFDDPIASPSVSPDGKRIALRELELGELGSGAAGRAATASRLVLLPRAGGEPVSVETPPDVFPFRAEWADADTLVYTASGGIFRQRLEGGEPVRVPFEVEVVLDRPDYRRRKVAFPEGRERVAVRGILRPVEAPDGSMIAFAALGDIWVVPTDGGDPVPLTRDEALDTDPSWSPDSRAIVFSSDREGSMDLWIKEVEAPPRAGEHRLTSAPGAELAPAWSPDGRTIAYVDERSRLHVIPAEGGEDRVLTPPHFGMSLPSWSSDSRHLVASVLERFSTRFREGRNRILVVDAATGDSRVLDEPEKSFGTRDGDGPVFRPDGGALAFAMDGGLFLLDVAPDGTPHGRPRRVLGEAVDFPSWSPDGRRILFVSPSGLKRLDVASGAVSRVGVNLSYEVLASGGRLLLRDVRVVDGTGAAPLEHQDVLIVGNRIESIAPTGAEPDPDLRVVDGSGRTVVPGLIDMHAHLSLPAWGSRHGKVWLAYGITSMRTPTDATFRVLEERESIQAGRRVGPRVFFTGGSLDGSRIYYTGALAVEDEEEVEQELLRAFDLGYDLIKTYVRLPDRLQKAVIERAHERGIFVTSHELYPAVAYGVDGIEHMSGTSRRGFSPKLTDMRRSYDDVVELIARSGVYFTPTVLIQGGWNLARTREPDLLEDARFEKLFPAFAQEDLKVAMPRDGSEAVVAPLFATIDAVAERGGRLLAGTDSPIVPYGLGLLLEIEQLSEAGLGPLRAIRSATQLAAEALGAAADLGTVEPGKLADLVILHGDPTKDIRNLRRTEMVVVNGRLLTVSQMLR